MAKADQAPEEIEDFIIRLKLTADIEKMVHEVDSKNDHVSPEKSIDDNVSQEEIDGEMSPTSCKRSQVVETSMCEDTQIEAKVNIGLIEGEVTEHSTRKIMECLIADFPFKASAEQRS